MPPSPSSSSSSSRGLPSRSSGFIPSAVRRWGHHLLLSVATLEPPPASKTARKSLTSPLAASRLALSGTGGAAST